MLPVFNIHFLLWWWSWFATLKKNPCVLLSAVPSPERAHYCSSFLTSHREGRLSPRDGHWEKTKVLLRAPVSPSAGLPVCLQQQKLTVEPFDAASWMKSLSNWMPLQTVHHPWQWQWQERKETCSHHHPLKPSSLLLKWELRAILFWYRPHCAAQIQHFC